MEGGAKLDKWGYEVNTCSDECIAAINAYYHQVLNYGRERSVILEAPKHDKDCVLAHILAAYSLCSTDSCQSRLHIQAAKSRLEEATSYEKAIFDALIYFISDDRDNDVALELHFKLLRDFPRDLVSLKRAQVLCFYMARPDLSLNLVQQAVVFHHLGLFNPHSSESLEEKVISHNEQEEYIYGMLAFPLLELGQMEDAKEAARKGLDINKQDCWSQHAICHVLQYECRFKEAVEFMEKCSSSWGSCSSFMSTHNWWHVALCYLEGHSPIEKVVEVYDQCIWKELERYDAVSSEVYLNALGLFLRVYVRGELNFFGNRMKVLSDCVLDQGNWYLEWHLDVLILWALAFSGDHSKAEELLKGLKMKFSVFNKKQQQVMQKGILLAEALFEYGNGNDKKALELLGPDFECDSCKIIGVSDEQLDVFKEVFYCILLNTGKATKAIEVIEKHINKREGNPFLWRLLERGYNMAGREQEATSAGQKAGALEAAYF